MDSDGDMFAASPGTPDRVTLTPPPATPVRHTPPPGRYRYCAYALLLCVLVSNEFASLNRILIFFLRKNNTVKCMLIVNTGRLRELVGTVGF